MNRQDVRSGPSDYGKGYRARPVDKKKYDEAYERVFGKKDEKPEQEKQDDGR